MTHSEDASVRTVVVAVAAALTGSAAMLAETTHSIADTCNEVLLYVGVRRGMRPADDRHPLGYGQARFFWSLLRPLASSSSAGCWRSTTACRACAIPSRSPTWGWAGSAVWDGAASLLIGLLLIGVAFVRHPPQGALLIDEAAPADVHEGLRRAVAEEPWVAEVAELTAVLHRPQHLLVLAHVVPVEGSDLSGIGRLRRRLLSLPAVATVEITPVERAS